LGGHVPQDTAKREKGRTGGSPTPRYFETWEERGLLSSFVHAASVLPGQSSEPISVEQVSNGTYKGKTTALEKGKTLSTRQMREKLKKRNNKRRGGKASNKEH